MTAAPTDPIADAAEALRRAAADLERQAREHAQAAERLAASERALDEMTARIERAAIRDDSRETDQAAALAAKDAEIAAKDAEVKRLVALVDDLRAVMQMPHGDERIPDTATVAEARAELEKRIGDGLRCPCCGQMAKRYRRKLNSGMASGLIAFYRQVAGLSEWVHVAKDTTLSRLGGDWAKLELWGLIESKVEDREDNGPHSGIWRLTEKGADFVRGQIALPAHVLIYDNQMLGYDDSERVTIRDALGKKFDYEELMGTRGVPQKPLRKADEHEGATA